MYAFVSLPVLSFTNKAPEKSTPVTEKGGASSTLYLGRGGGSGALYGFPSVLRQMTHFLIITRTIWRIDEIQNF
jgi:hypothetical protein